jgi:hypothetical protein
VARTPGRVGQQYHFRVRVRDHCLEQVRLTRAEYEAVRADPARFAVVPGHEKPDVERVVEQHAGYFVVQKNEGSHSPPAA